MRIGLFVCAVAMVFGAAARAQDGAPGAGFIAGTAPSHRPEGAPVITTYPKNGAWYDRALHGVDRPYPASLRWLVDQGAWFTPFTHPGMTPPYDIRGWHQGD